MLRILAIGDPKLRRHAEPIGRVGKLERRLAEEMVETMRRADGVGLAAPQVGVNRRLVVMEVPAGCESEDAEDWDWENTRIYSLVNPIITSLEDFIAMEEGCLSLPGYVASVMRARHVTAEAKDLRGRRVRLDATGLLAHVLQHETDHLDGTLVSDRVGSVLAMRQVKPPWVMGGRRRGRRPKGQAA